LGSPLALSFPQIHHGDTEKLRKKNVSEISVGFQIGHCTRRPTRAWKWFFNFDQKDLNTETDLKERGFQPRRKSPLHSSRRGLSPRSNRTYQV